MYTLGDLKADLRPLLWPTGEPANLVPDHNKAFVDAYLEIQRTVDCWQLDNYSVFPHCSTFYDCGLTVFPAPRGDIHRLSVIQKIDPATGLGDPAFPDDWCSEIFYDQIDPCHIHAYFAHSRRRGCCFPMIIPFFGVPPIPPVPTDAGLPPGLPTLPMGYHYAQASTDLLYGRRFHHGVWAIERGKIFVAPWIQSTESVVVMWDGKEQNFWDSTTKSWVDSTPIDIDPGDETMKKTVLEYVRWRHEEKWGRDPEAAQGAQAAYQLGLAELIYDCWLETRSKDCKASQARGASSKVMGLFFNSAQSASAQCPDGTQGTPTSVTVDAGTVSSNISVADANAKAQAQAQAEANARLVCTPIVPTFENDAQTATASCQGAEGAPPPEGNPVTITVPAGTVTSSVSKDDANAQALALAEEQAAAQLRCTFWNATQTYTATCPFDSGITVTKTVAQHTFSSALSQSDADQQALNDAKTQAENALVCPGSQIFWNTIQVSPQVKCTAKPLPGQPQNPPCIVTVSVIVAQHQFSSLVSQNDANSQALAFATNRAGQIAQQHCLLHECGNFVISYP